MGNLWQRLRRVWIRTEIAAAELSDVSEEMDRSSAITGLGHPGGPVVIQDTDFDTEENEERLAQLQRKLHDLGQSSTSEDKSHHGPTARVDGESR